MSRYGNEAPEEIDMRAVLTAALERWLQDCGLTQTAAASHLGTTQARVSDIKHGKISVSSPIARALIGKEAGDTADVQAPSGARSYDIRDVRYL